MVTKLCMVEKNPVRVDVRSLPPGNYQVLIISDRQYFSGRFSKMK